MCERVRCRLGSWTGQRIESPPAHRGVLLQLRSLSLIAGFAGFGGFEKEWIGPETVCGYREM
jgi:hypothetical protein